MLILVQHMMNFDKSKVLKKFPACNAVFIQIPLVQ